MLKITLHDSAGELRFRLEGRLSGAWVGELRQCWQTARSTVHSRKATLDLGEVDYVDADGQRGSFQQQHQVYGRAGDPCPICGTTIRRIVVGQRGTHYCPKCQRS